MATRNEAAQRLTDILLESMGNKEYIDFCVELFKNHKIEGMLYTLVNAYQATEQYDMALKELDTWKKSVVKAQNDHYDKYQYTIQEKILDPINNIISKYNFINIFRDDVIRDSKGSTIIDFTESEPKIIRYGDGVYI